MSDAEYSDDSNSSEASLAGEEDIADASTVSGSSTADEDSASDAETTLTRVTFGVPSAAEDHTEWECSAYTAGIEPQRSCLRDPHRHIARLRPTRAMKPLQTSVWEDTASTAWRSPRSSSTSGEARLTRG